MATNFDYLFTQLKGWSVDGQSIEDMLGPEAARPYRGSFNTNNPFQGISNQKLNDNTIYTNPVVSPEERIREIEHELDIIKGRIPTPKGYTISPSRVKNLLLELKQLQTKQKT